MRIIKNVTLILLAIFLVVGIGFLVVQRVLLFIASQQLVAEVSNLNKFTRQSTAYATCLEINQEFGLAGSDTTFQLRFLDSSRYILEYTCLATPKKPILVKEGSLPRYVTKMTGGSGFIYQNLEDTVIKLTAFAEYSELLVNRLPFLASLLQPSTTLVFSENKLTFGKNLPVTNTGPITTCEGYGYRCCQEGIEQGLGQAQESLDCPERCFSNCLFLPTILSFTASPNFDQYTRTINIQSGQTVDFYVVADTEPNSTLEFDFGDGNRVQVSLEELPVKHTYYCLSNSCMYQAVVSVKSSKGLSSVERFVSTMSVNITGIQ